MKYTFFGNENEVSMQSDSYFWFCNEKKEKGEDEAIPPECLSSRKVARSKGNRHDATASSRFDLMQRGFTIIQIYLKERNWKARVAKTTISRIRRSWSSMTKKAISNYNQPSADLWQRNPVIIPKGMAQFGINNRAHVSDHDQASIDQQV